MIVTNLDSQIMAPDWTLVAPDSPTGFRNQGIARIRIFRVLLALAARRGCRLVDLGAGPCVFAKLARDEGCAVTAVDARTERTPSEEDLGPIRFIQSDVRTFDLAGFDIIAALGLFYHFDLPDQLRFLEKCARTGVPVIFETQVHVDAVVPSSETRSWARNVVRRGKYEGVIFPERDNPMASVGNPESFWPTEASLLQMFEDAGFEYVAVVEPVFQSKYGARRFYLLNCREYVPTSERLPDIDLHNARTKFADLVDYGRFDAARDLFARLPRVSAGKKGREFILATHKMYVNFGEIEKARALASKLRDAVLDRRDNICAALLSCANLFETAGDADEAERVRALALERLDSAAQAKALIHHVVQSEAREHGPRLFAQIEKRFAADCDVLRSAAHAYYNFGNYEAAERVCRAALALEANDADTLACLGNALFRQRKLEESAAALTKAYELDSGNLTALERLTSIHILLKRLDDAERCARLLISASPLNPAAHQYLASALKQTDRRREALEHVRRAAELDPTNEKYRRHADELSMLVSADA